MKLLLIHKFVSLNNCIIVYIFFVTNLFNYLGEFLYVSWYSWTDNNNDVRKKHCPPMFACRPVLSYSAHYCYKCALFSLSWTWRRSNQCFPSAPSRAAAAPHPLPLLRHDQGPTTDDVVWTVFHVLSRAASKLINFIKRLSLILVLTLLKQT